MTDVIGSRAGREMLGLGVVVAAIAYRPMGTAGTVAEFPPASPRIRHRPRRGARQTEPRRFCWGTRLLARRLRQSALRRVCSGHLR
jgi:hypothetical protein